MDSSVPAPPIIPLPPYAIAQIKSSTTIISLVDVVSGLICNSLDANSTRIQVYIDFTKGSCVVEDDGVGIAASEFKDTGGLLKVYNTSKSQLSNVHGGHGTFLASVSTLSLLTISSRQALQRSLSTLICHQAKSISRFIPAPPQHDLSLGDNGTRVSVRNLFGNMPVRIKQRAKLDIDGEGSKECNDMVQEVVSLLVAWHKPVTVMMRDEKAGRQVVLRGQHSASLRNGDGCSVVRTPKSLDLTHILGLLTQATLIEPDSWASWVPVSGATSSISIKGAISLDPAPTKHTQFISLGIRPMHSNINNLLFDLVNGIFATSSFGVIEDNRLDEVEQRRRNKDGRFKQYGITNKQLKSGRKGVNRWPMFYLRIHPQGNSNSSTLRNEARAEDTLGLQSIIAVLGAMTTRWLTEHHFRPQTWRSDAKKTFHSRPPTPATSGNNQPISVVTANETPRPSTSSSFSSISRELSGCRSPLGSSPKGSAVRKRIKSSSRVRNTRPVLHSARTTPAQTRDVAGNGSAFRTWSRIKSARSDFYDQKLTEHAKPSTPKENMPSTATSDESNSLGTDPVHLIDISNTIFERNPTTQQASSLAMVPSEPVIPSPCSGDEHTALKEMHKDVQQGTDEVTPWMHPVTKKKFLLNTRSGTLIQNSKQQDNLTSGDARILSDGDRPSSKISGTSLRMEAKTLNSPRPAASTAWITRLLNKWDNPVFQISEKDIPQLSPNLTHETNANTNARWHKQAPASGLGGAVGSFQESQLSAAALCDVEIIAQVDRKFILVKMPCRSPTAPPPASSMPLPASMLVLIDQHAADERCKLESLFQDLCTYLIDARTASTQLPKPVTFDVPRHDAELLRTHAPYFAKWGMHYNLSARQADTPATIGSHAITVTALPPSILERCAGDPKLLIELLRSSAWARSSTPTRPAPPSPADTVDSRGGDAERHPWLRRIGDCPTGLLEMLKSRACRSAIMFNDVLTVEECRGLVRGLAACAFPFQCAHGRPCMVPLVGLGGFEGAGVEGVVGGCGGGGFGTGGDDAGDEVGRGKGFVDAFRRWRGQGRGTA